MTTAQAPDIATILDLEQAQESEDIAFFAETARRMGSPVLELGCGAGRLAIPMARAGAGVIGLDMSAAVLRRFKEKLVAESRPTRNRIRLVQADMRRFAMKKRFRAAFCSSNTLFLLGSENSIAEALECVRKHLEPGGKLIIDAAAIDPETRAGFARYPGGDLPDLTLPGGPDDCPLRRTHSIEARQNGRCKASFSKGTKQFSIKYKYFDDSGGLRAERRENLVLLTPEELLGLLRKRGYEIEEKFGWYDGRTFSVRDRKLIVVARKGE